MTHNFEGYRVPDLQKYLRNRGVTITGYNKNILKEIAITVDKLQLPEDPDFLKDSIQGCVDKKLARVGLTGCNPLTIEGFTKDFSDVPDFGLIDIFNYMIFSKADYDGKKLKGYKSFEDYRLFYDGCVEILEFNPLMDKPVCLFRAKVKPTQKDRTYLNKLFYDLWFVLDREDGYVLTAHCECQGGADGACRHVAAALYELEAFEKKSCTEGDNEWVKRPRHHDIPVPIRQLTVAKVKYVTKPGDGAMKPHIDVFDPRLENHRQPVTDGDKKEFGLRLQMVSENAQALDILLQPEDRTTGSDSNEDPSILKLSIMEKAREFVKINTVTSEKMVAKCKEFQNSIHYSNDEVSKVLESTEGQAGNKLWHGVRKGMLTASNFGKASHYMEIEKDPPPSFVKAIMGESLIDEQYLPKPLKWGRQKEPVARIMYKKLCRREHVSLRVKETGILLNEQYPSLGCSVDGVVSCNCRPIHSERLVEIKCPYASRDKMPKEAAIEHKVSYNKNKNRWEVAPDCPYYPQIQGQLGLYGVQECDLVIYTKHGIHVATAVFNSVFFSQMLKNVLLFHEKYIISAILQKVLSE